jgi:hypothetical protein
MNKRSTLEFDYLIRFRGNIKVTAADGETRMAVDWVGQDAHFYAGRR